ncbi:hypothetical protein [Porphyromonas sp.]
MTRTYRLLAALGLSLATLSLSSCSKGSAAEELRTYPQRPAVERTLQVILESEQGLTSDFLQRFTIRAPYSGERLPYVVQPASRAGAKARMIFTLPDPKLPGSTLVKDGDLLRYDLSLSAGAEPLTLQCAFRYREAKEQAYGLSSGVALETLLHEGKPCAAEEGFNVIRIAERAGKLTLLPKGQ